jgi:hypothetical protein
MKLGVELANLLHLDLLGLFIEDADLRQLASIPLARELRLLGGGWQPIELGRLTRELELAARRTERLFAEAAKPLLTRHQFEVVRGATRETIASVSRADDILMLAEPSGLAERATHQFTSFSRAALESAASVMFVPPYPVRSAGAVAVIVRSADEVALRSAAAIAAAAAEPLILCVAENGGLDRSAHAAVADTGVKIGSRSLDRRALAEPRALAHELEGLRDRLLVVTRGAISDDAARTLASLRRIPVLMIEPAGHGEGP